MAVGWRSRFQLLSLMAAHFVIDMLGGLLPGFLPVAREHFGLSLGAGVVLLAIMGIGSNLFQIPAGLVRRHARLPLMIQCGMVLSMLIFLFGFLPGGTPVWVLAALMFLVGIGIAFVHPEGLRGTLAVDGISSSVCTSLFMVSGFLGFAAGPLAGAWLVGHFRLPGLLLLIPLPLLVVLGIYRSRVRLAVDSGGGRAAGQTEQQDQPWSYWHLFTIAVFMNAGSATLQGLLPSYLHETGFPLTFCGMSAMLFGIGSAAGSLLFGVLAKRYRPSRFIMIGLAAGLPVIAGYFLLSGFRGAIWLTIPAGMLLSAGFPLIVVLARNAPGRLSLSMRLAWIVGGSWSAATAILLLVGQLADRIGLGRAMNAVWLCYLVALIVAVAGRRRFRWLR